MVGIVIVAHTPVASAMLGFAEHTFGVLPERVRAVDIPPHEDTKASFDRVMKAAYGVNTGNGVLPHMPVFKLCALKTRCYPIHSMRRQSHLH